jgi:hypothetical protein
VGVELGAGVGPGFGPGAGVKPGAGIGPEFGPRAGFGQEQAAEKRSGCQASCTRTEVPNQENQDAFKVSAHGKQGCSCKDL